MFSDRDEAAILLAEKLKKFQICKPLVLAIPRGAVPMGKIIADALNGDFDVVLVRKLRAPHQPEFAIGSVNESGWTFVAEHAANFGASKDYIDEEKARQMETIRERRRLYTPIHAPVDPKGRVVIVVDDGLATGATMMAALQGLRIREPAKLICAVPVAPADTLAEVSSLADEVVCLEVPINFHAVGQFYRHFPQVDDDEVVDILKDHHPIVF